jgi:hypothetical protein
MKLVVETSLYYDARSEKHQIIQNLSIVPDKAVVCAGCVWLWDSTEAGWLVTVC